MKRILITGGTGFVGANLTRRLIAEGHEVHLLVRPGFQSWRIETIRDHIRLHEVSLVDKKALMSVVKGIKPEWIFHLAAHGAYSWQTDVSQIIQTNVIGTANLVEACLKCGFEAFINTGSSSEYGFKDHPPMETEWVDPNSYYAVGKASATLFCRHTAQHHQVQMPTVRLYSVYGPFEDPRRLMPTLIQYGLKGQLPPLVDPTIARDYIYVEDVITAFLLVATMPNQEVGAVYNLGSGIQTSLAEVVTVACRIMDIRQEPQWGSMPNRQWDTAIWVADNQKIKHALNWKPGYTFETGFRSMVEWFQDNPDQQQFYASH